ncbi:piggyBac transposable element-derived protein 4-like [Anthonomus grandis grandis]|uniref:piggyBac transposable element-derived protein 4-like n=1 Tax=Anthonomus grandis grandis TaxID=2921223 RepID=UPI002164F9E7|nr:piggyBac transposable element-derived protein 4-like [Anthonomus grandis grandis]
MDGLVTCPSSSADYITILDEVYPVPLHGPFVNAVEDAQRTPQGFPPCRVSHIELKHELHFFELLVSDDVINKIIVETNRYAEQQIILAITNENIGQYSRLNAWVDTNCNEIRTFIAILIWMGLDKKPSLKDYWRKHPLDKNEISKYLPRNRFELLLRMFHLANNEDCPPNDRLHKIQCLVDMLNKNASFCIIPEESLCIDETMIPFRGKGKRHKFGIKVYKVCLDGGFTYSLKVYCGKEKINGQSVAESIVMEMLQPLLDSSRTLFADNRYTSIPLAENLQNRSTHLAETIPCGNVSELEARIMQEDKTPWTCNNCLVMNRRSSGHFSQLETSSHGRELNVMDHNRGVSSMFVKSETSLVVNRDIELKALIQDVQNEIKEMRKSMDFLNEKYEDELKRTKILSEMVT